MAAWMALLWLTARMLRTGEPRWWIGLGLGFGIAMLNKSLVVLLGVAVLLGLIVARRWDLLKSPWLLGGVVISAGIAAPNVYWQASNGWPQAEMARVLAERLGTENRILLVPLQILLVGPAFFRLMRRGGRWLAGDGGGSLFRPLLWAWVAAMTMTFITGGRPYYPVPLTVVLLLAGVVAYEERTGRTRPLRSLIFVNGLGGLLLALPILPLSMVNVSSTVNEALAETVGWPGLVAQVAETVDSLPQAEQQRVVLLAASYGEAGAIDRFGPTHGLPPAHSGHNSYADLRRPTNEAATVVAVRYEASFLNRWFDTCDQVAVIDNGYHIDNEAQGEPIVVCRGLRSSWEDVWPELRHVS